MMARVWISLGLAGLLAAATSAQAADITRTTDAGKPVMVTRHVTLDAGCGGTIPQIDVSQPPAHGTVDVRPQRFVLTGAFAGRTDCVGREVDGGAVWYTPAAGFHGSDSFVSTTRYAGARRSTTTTDNVQITVK